MNNTKFRGLNKLRKIILTVKFSQSTVSYMYMIKKLITTYSAHEHHTSKTHTWTHGWPHSFVPVVSVSLGCEWALPPSVESPWSAQVSATSGGSACAVSLYRTCQQHWQWFVHVCLLSFFWKEWISWAQTTSTVWKLAASSTWRILSH